MEPHSCLKQRQSTLAVLLLALVPAVVELVLATDASAAFPNVGDSTSLGVRVLKPMYVLIPETRDGHRNVTAVMTLWLRRVGAAKGPYDMAHQAQDALRFVAWVDSPRNLQMRVFGHLALPTEHHVWRPRLMVEAEVQESASERRGPQGSQGGVVLEAVFEPSGRQYGAVWGQSPRPYSLRVDLPPGVANCFKILEATYPKHKASVCLPPAATDGACNALAPPASFSPARPALYTAIGPVRHVRAALDWRHYMSLVARRLVNYVSYHVAMGVTGLLQYTDELMREYLSRDPEILDLLRKGHLRFVRWDMPERSHDDNDGGGRPLGYNYDQALVASHVLLGTSACGAHMLVLVTDLDEYLYFPQPGRRWPEPWGICMGPTHGSDPIRDPVTVLKVQRYDLVTSRVTHKDEARLWTRSGAMPDGDSMAAAATTAAGGGLRPPHPMSVYDLLSRKRMSKMMVKQAQLPAAGVVLYFVHEGTPLYGRTQLVHHRCAAILHLPNFFRGRRSSASPGEWRPFRHWMFVEPGTNGSVWEL